MNEIRVNEDGATVLEIELPKSVFDVLEDSLKEFNLEQHLNSDILSSLDSRLKQSVSLIYLKGFNDGMIFEYERPE